MKESNQPGLPDLFGKPIKNNPSAKRKSVRRKSDTKSKTRHHRKNNDPTLFDFNDPDINLDYTASELASEAQSRLERITLLARNLGLELVPNNNDASLPYIKHYLLAENKFEAREYSLSISSQLGSENGLIILPTGLGKTYVALNIMLTNLLNKQGKILFLVPTRPLAQQHVMTFRALLPKIKSAALTGHVSKKKRMSLWRDNQIIMATPQTIMSELKQGNKVGSHLGLSMVIIDEVHHQVGNYDYVSLARYYRQASPDIQMLGLTATPDLDIEKVKAWARQLGVSRRNIFARSFDSADVKAYTHYRRVIPHYLERNLTDIQKEFKLDLAHNLTKVVSDMQDLLSVRIDDYIYLNKDNLTMGINIKGFNALRDGFIKGTKMADKRFTAYKLLSLYGSAMLYNAALHSLHNGLSEFSHFLERQYDAIAKTPRQFQKRFCLDAKVQDMVKKLYFFHLWSGNLPPAIYWPDKSQDWYVLAWKMALNDSKLSELESIIERAPSGRQVIIFTNYRDTLRKLRYYLMRNFPDKKVGVMTGTSSKLHDPGMSHKDQLKALQEFRQGELDILVSTSVGEEGLDFPAVDTVVFYEPIAEIRRYVQRLGRTGRHRDGTVHIMLYRDTEEETIFYTSRAHDRSMKKIIKYLERA